MHNQSRLEKFAEDCRQSNYNTLSRLIAATIVNKINKLTVAGNLEWVFSTHSELECLLIKNGTSCQGMDVSLDEKVVKLVSETEVVVLGYYALGDEVCIAAFDAETGKLIFDFNGENIEELYFHALTCASDYKGISQEIVNEIVGNYALR